MREVFAAGSAFGLDSLHLAVYSAAVMLLPHFADT